jgi:hypothetical protein
MDNVANLCAIIGVTAAQAQQLLQVCMLRALPDVLPH